MTVHYTRVLILHLERSTPIPRLIFRFRPLLSVDIMNASRLQTAAGKTLRLFVHLPTATITVASLSRTVFSLAVSRVKWNIPYGLGDKCRHQYATFRGGACLKLPDLLACSSSSSSRIGIIFEISKQLWIIAPEIIRFFGYKMHSTSDE